MLSVLPVVGRRSILLSDSDGDRWPRDTTCVAASSPRHQHSLDFQTPPLDTTRFSLLFSQKWSNQRFLHFDIFNLTLSIFTPTNVSLTEIRLRFVCRSDRVDVRRLTKSVASRVTVRRVARSRVNGQRERPLGIFRRSDLFQKETRIEIELQMTDFSHWKEEEEEEDWRERERRDEADLEPWGRV